MERLRILAAVAATTLSCMHVSSAVAQEQPEARYFAVIDAGTVNRHPQEFIIKLTDPERILQARTIVLGLENSDVHIVGLVVPERAAYNDLWTFHLDPASVHFFTDAQDHCDAKPTEVEERLDEVGTSFLVSGLWCPSKSRVIRELKM